MKKFFPLFLLASLCSTSLLAQNRYSHGYPSPAGQQLVPITINYNPNSVIRSERNFIRIDLMSRVVDQLRQSGVSANPYDYKIRSLIVHTKSYAGQGQIRLCAYQQPLNARSECYRISQSTVAGDPASFDNSRFWATYPLVIEASRQALEFPVDIEFLGRIRLHSITLILEPIRYSGHPTPHPLPIPVPPIVHPPHNPNVPNFLLGVNIFENYGPALIGQRAILEKSLSGRLTDLTFQNTNYVFKNFHWINLTSIQNDSIIEQITVRCLDLRGYDVSFRAQNSRGQLIQNILVQSAQTLTFPVGRECVYIQNISVKGYSPNAVGSRARIEMVLN